MNRTVLRIPSTKNCIFFNYTYIYNFASCIPRHIKSMIQQFFPDSIVSIFRQHRKMIQLTLFIILYKQRIISTQYPIFPKNIHLPILIVHLPIQFFTCNRKCSKARRICFCKSQCNCHCYKTLLNQIRAYRYIFTFYCSYPSMHLHRKFKIAAPAGGHRPPLRSDRLIFPLFRPVA